MKRAVIIIAAAMVFSIVAFGLGNALAGPSMAEVTFVNDTGTQVSSLKVGDTEILTQPMEQGETITVALDTMTRDELWDAEVQVAYGEVVSTYHRPHLFPGCTAVIEEVCLKVG